LQSEKHAYYFDLMHKLVRNISVVFLWIAWAVLTAHLMIPHDHHLLESFNVQEESCPASNTTTSHHHELPVHCHAFNDLASEKAITYVLKINIQSDYLPFSYDNSFTVPDPKFSFASFIYIREPFPDSYILEFSSLRAPPIYI
jgi:hypothetical protein